VNLQQLSYFVAIARVRNFTRAAEACFVAQPALSQQIRKLEDELGLPVFERRRRGVKLTVAGTAFLAYAEQALKLVAEGRQRVSDLHEMRRGVISLICLPTAATYWLPPIVARYRDLHPDVAIQMHEHPGCTPQEFRDCVADFGVVQVDDERGADAGKDLRIERLFTDEQVLIFPVDHALLARFPSADRPIPLQAVAQEEFVLAKSSCGMSRVTAQAFASAGVQPRVRFETSQVEAVREMVSAGLGIAVMPAMAMRRGYPNVACRRIRKPAPRRTIALASRAERALSPAAAALVAMIRDAAKVQRNAT
jgi:DNA-binding transcriptional LysR family regulator